jgi:hypothetical protein
VPPDIEYFIPQFFLKTVFALESGHSGPFLPGGMQFDERGGAICVRNEAGVQEGSSMVHGRRRSLSILLSAIGFVLAACGGGGTEPAQSQIPGPGPAGPVSVLSWDPPANYTDNAAMDPYRDLDHYELYVRQDANFADTDLPVATIAAVTDASGAGGSVNKVLEKEFILENVEPFIPQGSRHYVSLKAVGIDGQKSPFMAAVAWDKI